MTKSCHLRKDPALIYHYATFDHTLDGAAAIHHILPTSWSCNYSDDGAVMSIFTPGGEEVYLDSWTYVLVDMQGVIELHADSSFRVLFQDDQVLDTDEENLDTEFFDLMGDGGILWGG